MCLPMMPAGPESEVMNPILTGSAARATCPTSRPATRPRTTLTLSARTLTSLGWRGILARQRDDVVATADRKSTRLNSSHSQISYAVFCLKKKTQAHDNTDSSRLVNHKPCYPRQREPYYHYHVNTHAAYSVNHLMPLIFSKPP